MHLFDLRYNRMNVRDYMAQNEIDQAVVLYSLSNLVTDNNLFLLSR